MFKYLWDPNCFECLLQHLFTFLPILGGSYLFVPYLSDRKQKQRAQVLIATAIEVLKRNLVGIQEPTDP